MKPDVIIRSNRRSLSITISKNGDVIVRAPKRLSMDYIMAFIKDKEKWITRKQKEIEDGKQSNYNIANYNTFLFCGKQYKRLDMEGIKKLELTNTNMVVPKGIDKSKLTGLLQKWYMGLCKDIITNRLDYFANLMMIDYDKVSYMNNKTRWGSCSKDATIKFNFRILMLPHRVIDYIIVHELSHLVEFNHGPKFYALVESVMPDYKEQKRILKQYSYLLELYR